MNRIAPQPVTTGSLNPDITILRALGREMPSLIDGLAIRQEQTDAPYLTAAEAGLVKAAIAVLKARGAL